jgi:hypothetical protein
MLDLSRETPFGEVGYITLKRTYARRLNGNDQSSETEEFPDIVRRVIKACRTQLKVGFTPEEEQVFADQLLGLKGSVAGRFWWQLGTKTVSKLGLPSLQNCAFTTVDEPIRPFTWAMDMLMLGCGVGFNIQREYVYQLPKVSKKKFKITRVDNAGADYIIPDTREGWTKLLGKVLKSYFYSGKGFTYSTQLIRGKGAPIKSFGGTASGAEILVEGIGHIIDVLEKRRGKRVEPIDCLDIMNIIGMIVVAGNVRRSALIALGDYDDLEFLRAKRWDLGNIPNWRSNSNNSVVCDDISKLPEEFWEGYKGNGEPYGLINLEASRKQGRLGEIQYPDPDVAGYNPCAEQSLADKETCCLAEIFLPNIDSQVELVSVATNLYRVCKHSLSLACHHPETEEVVHKNMRMGIGVTGYAMATEEQRGWLDATYQCLRVIDREYSALHGWPTSIKLTTVKPSGTLSLLAGVTSGGHPAYAEYYIRRIRIASDSPLVEVCRASGFKVEYVRNFDGTDDHRTVVVEFPCKTPEHAIFARDITAIDQLEMIKRLQTEWSDNAVSVTIYYKLEELPAIKEWLALNFTDCVKSVSFLLHSEHGFDQAPLEEITQEQYLELSSRVTPITSVSFNEDDISEDQMACPMGGCPLK